MKKLIVYVPVLLFCVFTVQLKAEENAVVSSDTPVLTDIQVIDQDPNLSSSLVWDKNKSTKKEKKKKSDFGKQMRKNANFGWNTYKTDDYKWRNIFIGTGYGRDFENAKDAYWQVGLNLTKRKLMEAIPGLGALVGAAMNANYLQDVGWTARRKFQSRWLRDKYPQLRDEQA